ncbi:hypothetical protein cypCar_00048511 [Cyprinus carpio]|nr:hypothetical protein cypCar_00048511 [Cyprinus carpio]
MIFTHYMQLSFHCDDDHSYIPLSPTAEIKKEMALALTCQFPCLKNSEGHGYEAWYTPGRYLHPVTGYLEERLPATVISEFLFSTKFSTASFFKAFSVLLSFKGVRAEIAFKTLPAILPSSPYRTNGKMVCPTYTEMKQSFIDIQPVGTNIVQYLNHEASQNPQVLVLGDKEDSSQVFIIFNGEAMEQETLLQAVDLCFKLFFVYDINYPKPSAPIWEFLEHTVFNIPGGVPSAHCLLLKNFVFSNQ